MNIEEELGPDQRALPLFSSAISQRVWELKYKRENEKCIQDTLSRVAIALSNGEQQRSNLFYSLMNSGVFFPAGRVLAGAGLIQHSSTLMNCYVMGVLEDSLDGIMQCLHESAKTQKFGGGIGVDFTPLRPKGAEIKTAAYFAGGPVAFMGLWDAMGHALEAGGNRRGGKMATLACTHPDIVEFIQAKSRQGKLTSFNISVLISDRFMEAVENDEPWALYHKEPRHDQHATQERVDIEGHKVYIWDILPARELWDLITKNTYMYSEPGVIFIDRMNELNPLFYCEDITCTNPCGEQPLPPYGACNLGSINLARMVKRPFGTDADVNWDLLKIATEEGVDFLNAVLDVTKFPLREQLLESDKKRRIGLGITGLADMLGQLKIPYGSDKATLLAEKVMQFIANAAYRRSAMLAERDGAFPLYIPTHLTGKFVQRLDEDARKLIEECGLRNGVILSIAPTGTISTVFGDVSSGCEPVFDHRTIRKIKVKDAQNNDVFEEQISYSYTVRMYAEVHAISEAQAYDFISNNPEIWPTAQDLSPSAHIEMQGRLQYWVDSSISKTINVPEDTPLEDFQNIYMRAYEAGCKGCTTYRRSETRDEVLVSTSKKKTVSVAATGGEKTVDDDVPAQPEVISDKALKITADGKQLKGEPSENIGELTEETALIREVNGKYKRPPVLGGLTYKIPWPGLASPVFITINHDQEYHPVEVFIASKNAQWHEWSIGMSVMISQLLQHGVAASEVGQHLKEINLSQQPAWFDQRLYGSIISYIGKLIADHKGLVDPTRHIAKDMQLQVYEREATATFEEGNAKPIDLSEKCKFCGSFNVEMMEGCLKCTDCGMSDCG